MVLDGDGDIIFSTPPRRTTLFLLAMIELGIRLKKPVFLVNSMISDCPSTGCNQKTLTSAASLFTQCRAVALRDPASLEYVRKNMRAVKSWYIPDSLFAWYPYYADEKIQLPDNGDSFLPYPELDEYWGKLDFSRPYIVIGGGAAASSQPARSIECYKGLVDAVKQLGCAVYLAEADYPDEFLREVAREKNIGLIPAHTPILMCGAVLARARLFISGRYHPSIFASLGGTPCIFLASHAHKMGSLGRVLELDAPRQFSAFPNAAELVEIVAMARVCLNQGEALRERIKKTAQRRCEEVSQLPAFIKSQLN
jgi:polysaccharide pyruvyl transferase WcaK-like protein